MCHEEGRMVSFLGDLTGIAMTCSQLGLLVNLFTLITKALHILQEINASILERSGGLVHDVLHLVVSI